MALPAYATHFIYENGNHFPLSAFSRIFFSMQKHFLHGFLREKRKGKKCAENGSHRHAHPQGLNFFSS